MSEGVPETLVGKDVQVILETDKLANRPVAKPADCGNTNIPEQGAAHEDNQDAERNP